MSTCLDFAERTPIAICDVERSFITFLEPPDERCANRGRSRLVYLTDDGLRGGPSNCKRLWPAEASRWSKVSSGGPSLVSDCSGCSQGPPNAILAMASCTATDNVPHQPRLNVGRCCADGVHGLLAFQPEQVRARKCAPTGCDSVNHRCAWLQVSFTCRGRHKHGIAIQEPATACHAINSASCATWTHARSTSLALLAIRPRGQASAWSPKSSIAVPQRALPLRGTSVAAGAVVPICIAASGRLSRNRREPGPCRPVSERRST